MSSRKSPSHQHDDAGDERYTGPPATLGSTAAAQARLVVWCRDCQHQLEPDPAEQAARYGAELAARDWVRRLKCSKCGSKQVVSCSPARGDERPPAKPPTPEEPVVPASDPKE